MPYQRILDLMCPRGHRNLFLLGNFAKRVTLYSQQVRAINLIDAIHFYQQPLAGVDIAVVGAGASGLTAAARALGYRASVTLFEQNSDIMSVQTNSRHRWLHPKIYEWPAVPLGGASEDAQLPVMSWHAQFADKLASDLKEQWQTIVAANPERVRLFNPARVTAAISKEAGYELKYIENVGKAEQVKYATFSIVIFAVGFGLEPPGVGRNSYWEQDPLDQISRPGAKNFLLAGYGDGALTDLMRIRLTDFDHAKLLNEVVRALSKQEIDEIDRFERSRDAMSAASLTRWYAAQRFSGVQDVLKKRLRKLTHIVLTGRGPHFLDPRASALNRLVVSQLRQLDAFDFVAMEPSEEIKVGNQSDSVIARIQRAAGVTFSDIILRFGPESEVAKVELPPNAVSDLKSRWDVLRPQDDPTRVPLWAKFEPISHDVEHCCIAFFVPGHNQGKSGLPPVVQSAIDRLLAERKNSKLEITDVPQEVKGVSVADCLRGEESLTHTVRALCRAPVAVFDLGPKMGQGNPAGMFLLGIRAAVRRGLTLVVHKGAADAAAWSELPFNLKELPLLSIQFDTEGADELKETVETGLTILNNEADGYRDLPVFEIVRRTSRRIPEAKHDKLEVFVLCPFSKAYTKKSWRRLQLLVEGVDKVAQGKLELKRVVDYASPLLVGERLYELIRHAGLCLVDWSDWRANVFFEFGVRLAVKSTMPICVINASTRNLDNATKVLRDLFDPLPYAFDGKVKDGTDKFQTEFHSRVGSIARIPNNVYAAAESNILLSQEYGQMPQYDDAVHRVDAMMGTDLVTSGKMPILYAANPGIALQAWRSAVEALAAARLLLLRKIELAKTSEEWSQLGDRLTEVNSKLLAILEHDLDPEYQRYAEGAST